MRLGRFTYIQFLLAALMAALLACSDDNPAVVLPCDEQTGECGDAVSSSSRHYGPDSESASSSSANSIASSSSAISVASSSSTPIEDLSSGSHEIPVFIQNDDQYTGFYKQDGYEAFRKMSYPSKTEMGASYLVKFIISDFGTDSAEVHFMHSTRYLYHFDFAQMVLDDPRSLAVFNQ